MADTKKSIQQSSFFYSVRDIHRCIKKINPIKNYVIINDVSIKIID